MICESVHFAFVYILTLHLACLNVSFLFFFFFFLLVWYTRSAQHRGFLVVFIQFLSNNDFKGNNGSTERILS